MCGNIFDDVTELDVCGFSKNIKISWEQNIIFLQIENLIIHRGIICKKKLFPRGGVGFNKLKAGPILTRKVLFLQRSLKIINPFVPNEPFLYPLKTSENRKIFRCFNGVQKGCIGNK